MADTATLMAAIVDLLPDEARIAADPHRGGRGPHPTLGVTVSAGPSPGPRSGRGHGAVEALKVVNWLSRSLGRGSGTVAGGRVGLALDPSLLAILATGRRVALVSGTNGKTTTTRMLVAALATDGDGLSPPTTPGPTCRPVTPRRWPERLRRSDAVLEVDEGYLGRLIDETRPRVVVLLNLSRDQLDRISEVRMLVDRWRRAMDGLPLPGRPTRARWWWPTPTTRWWCGRPLAAPDVRWVGAGQVWHNDAVGCPACGGRIVFDGPRVVGL